MSDPYTPIEDLFEPLLTQFKAELIDLDIFDDVSEGENIYEGGKVAWVIPGPINIASQASQMLRHDMTIWVITMDEADNATQEELRVIGAQAYNALMADISQATYNFFNFEGRVGN